MAIVFEKERRHVNWMGILFVIFFLGSLGAALYYLFFAPKPKIAYILPTAIKELNTVFSPIDPVKFDPAAVVDGTAFKRLQSPVVRPGPGSIGRDNPFLPF